MIRLLISLRILDEDRTLSLSNLLVFAITYKIIVVPTMDWAALATLVPVLGSYAHRKHLRAKHQSNQQDKAQELQQLRDDHEALAKTVQMSRLDSN